MAKSSAGKSALHRNLLILQAFDAWRPYLTLSEIADAAGLARSSTHRLLTELVREGLVERLADRTYRLGMRLWELASRTPGAVGLREIAKPWLAAVHAKVRQHVQLGVLSGHDILYLERLSMRDAVLNATVIGGRIPLYASSLGQVLLAAAPAATVDEVCSGGFEAFTSKTIRTGDELRSVLSKVRRNGFAIADGQIHEDSRGIATGVIGPEGVTYAAIGVVVANDSVDPMQHVDLLRRAARGISNDLIAAYSPAKDEHFHSGLRSLVSGSERSLEYLEQSAGQFQQHSHPNA